MIVLASPEAIRVWPSLQRDFLNFADRTPVIRVEEYGDLDVFASLEIYRELELQITQGRISYNDFGADQNLFQRVGQGVFAVYISGLMFACTETRQFFKAGGKKDLGMLRCAIDYCRQGIKEVDAAIAKYHNLRWLWPAYEWFDHRLYKYSGELAEKIVLELRGARRISRELLTELAFLRAHLRREWKDLKVSWWEPCWWWLRSKKQGP